MLCLGIGRLLIRSIYITRRSFYLALKVSNSLRWCVVALTRVYIQKGHGRWSKPRSSRWRRLQNVISYS